MSVLSKCRIPSRRDRDARRAPNRRAVRLGLEALDERVMPVTNCSLSRGVLSIAGSGQVVKLAVMPSFMDSSTTIVFDKVTNQSWNFANQDVKRITMTGSGPKVTLENLTSLPSTMTGGTGTNTLTGGPGNDIFHVTTDNDVINGNGGRDVLYRNGHHGYFRDSGDPIAAGYLTVGQVQSNAPGLLSPKELAAKGTLTASLDPNNPQRLILNGPSGASVVLDSSWQKQGRSFVTSSKVSLELGTTNVPVFPATDGVSLFTVNLKASPVDDAWGFDGISFPFVPSGSSTTNLQNAINATTGSLGVSVQMPNKAWGIGLGSDVMALDDSAPLNNAVPYLYEYKSDGFQVNSSNISVASTNSTSSTIAFAPSDGGVYLSYNDFGMAYSPNGYIPYVPDVKVTGIGAPSIYGQFYMRGPIQGEDWTVDGSIVMDLDVNDTGSLAAVNSSMPSAQLSALSSTYRSASQGHGRDLVNSALNNIAIGINGTLELGLNEFVTVTVGKGSGWYTPGCIAFAGASTNPFEGLGALEKLNNTNFKLSGWATWTPGSASDLAWALDAKASTGSFSAVSVSNLRVQAGSDINSITASGSFVVPSLGTFDASGSIGFNGSVSLSASVTKGTYDHGDHWYTSSQQTTTITIGWSHGNFSFSGSYDASGEAHSDYLGTAGYSIHAGLDVFFMSSYGSTEPQLTVVASGSVTGWYESATTGYMSVSIGFLFTNNSLTLDIPIIGDITITW
ncbi:MAG: hypothetical protein U0800_06455 [Isosphaeraceae bacterium]